MATYLKLWKSNRKSTISVTHVRTLEDTKEKFKNLSEEAALKALLKVIEIMKCKVCKSVLSLPMVFNNDGDVVCKTCFSSDSKIPDAKPLSPVEESILTSVVLVIPCKCRYKGCPFILVPGDDHKVWCGFQETSCKLCDWLGAARDILCHAKTAHELMPIEMEELDVSRELEAFDPNKDLTPTFTPFLVGNVFLWIVHSVDANEQEFRSHYMYVPNGKPTTKISVEIVFGEECLQNINAIKKELNLNPMFSTTTRNSIVFPTSVLDAYINQNNVLQWKEVFSVTKVS